MKVIFSCLHILHSNSNNILPHLLRLYYVLGSHLGLFGVFTHVILTITLCTKFYEYSYPRSSKLRHAEEAAVSAINIIIYTL